MLHCILASMYNSYVTFEHQFISQFDLLGALKKFENQWIYSIGFGLPSSIIVDFIDGHLLTFYGIEPKLGIFLLAPILILMSFDPKGCGCEHIEKRRKTDKKVAFLRTIFALNFGVAQSMKLFVPS